MRYNVVVGCRRRRQQQHQQHTFGWLVGWSVGQYTSCVRACKMWLFIVVRCLHGGLMCCSNPANISKQGNKVNIFKGIFISSAREPTKIFIKKKKKN